MIAVECSPDEGLLRVLDVSLDHIVHSHGRGNVFNAVLQRRVAIGLVDEDPGGGPMPQLAKFVAKERVGSLALLTSCDDPSQRVIVISPRFEEWVMKRAGMCGILPGDYGLPNTARALHRTRRYAALPKYRDFLLAVLKADKEMQTLRTWVLA